MRCDQVKQRLLLGFRPLPVASLRGHARLPREPPTGAPRISRYCGDSCDQPLQTGLKDMLDLPRQFGPSGVQIRPHHLSRLTRPTEGTTTGWLIQFLQTVEARPHIFSYLIYGGETGMCLTLDSIFRGYAILRNLGVQESGGSCGSAVEKITARSQKRCPYPKWREFSSQVTGPHSGGSGPWPKNACCLGGLARQTAPSKRFQI